MELFEGFIKRVFFTNEETGFGAFLLENASGISTKVSGVYPDPTVGEYVLCRGSRTTHEKFGEQLEASEMTLKVPLASSSSAQMVRFIVAISGLRVREAKKILTVFSVKDIVSFFNGDTLRDYDQSKQEILAYVITLKSCWSYVNGVREIADYLIENGVSSLYAKKLYKAYKEAAIAVLQDNPYKLLEKFGGLNFRDVDEIGLKLGTTPDNLNRVFSGEIAILKDALTEGSTFLPLAELLEKSAKLLKLPGRDRLLVEGLKLAKEKGYLSVVKNSVTDIRIYLEWVKKNEDYCMTALQEINDFPNTGMGNVCVSKGITDISKKVSELIDDFGTNTGFTLSDEQKQAIKLVFDNKINIITGSPGTGKTTVCKCILYIFNKLGITFSLGSPTGRASKRLSEVTGAFSQTIHRLLEYSPREGGFQRNENNPLESHYILIDEFSMVDIFLFKNLLAAIDKSSSVIFVGDADQLPSVQAGNVLRDLIDSNRFPKIHLSKIYRQDDSNLIVLNAHAINKGESPKLLPLSKENDKLSDFLYSEITDPQTCLNNVKALYQEQLRRGLTPESIQILTPKKEGLCGIKNLNIVIQDLVNGDTFKPSLKSGDIVFRVGDRVLQLKNDYDYGIFNGDVGVIKDIDVESEILDIDFGDVQVSCGKDYLKQMQLAYAMTIHKSQGSEYPVVIMPLLVKEHYIMLYRNLFYTGITRAKRKLYLVGEKKAVSIAVKNVKTIKRYTGLFK